MHANKRNYIYSAANIFVITKMPDLASIGHAAGFDAIGRLTSASVCALGPARFQMRGGPFVLASVRCDGSLDRLCSHIRKHCCQHEVARGMANRS